MDIKNDSSKLNLNLSDYIKTSPSTSASGTSFDSYLSNNKDKFNNDNSSKYADLKVKKEKLSPKAKELVNKKTAKIKTTDKNQITNEADKVDKDEKIDPTDKTDKIDKTNKTDKTKGKDKVKSEDVVAKVDDVVEKAIDDIAKVLKIEPEVLMSLMKTLDFSIQDLSDNGNLTKLMMMAKDVTSPAQLLTLDNVKEEIVDIKNILENLPKEAKNILQPKTEVKAEDATKSKTDTQAVNTNNVNTIDTSSNDSQGNTKSDNKDSKNPFAQVNIQVQNVNPDDEVKANQKGIGIADIDLNTEAKPVIADIKTNETVAQSTNVDSSKSSVDMIQSQQNTNIQVSYLEQATKAMSLKNVNPQEVVNQLIEAMKVEVKSDISSEIKITLNPANLGDVTLKLATENGAIVAQFVADSQRIKEIIESNFNSLRDSLMEQGIEVSGLEVSVRQESQGNENLSENSNSGNRSGTGQTNGIFEDDNIEISSTTQENKNKALGSTTEYKA